MIDASQLPLKQFTAADTIRLISTAYIDEPAMLPLVDTPEELAMLEELEVMTSARQNKAVPLPMGLSEGELLTRESGYGWSFVNAAFCYTRLAGNRFNGPERGAWYAAWGEHAVDTALQEVRWHLTQELAAVGNFENKTAYRELVAGFTTGFHDLRNIRDEKLWSEDPAIAYPVGQALARQLLELGSNGVLYPSVRREGGQCLAGFRPNIVQNIRQGQTWILNWHGSPEPEISRSNID